MTPGLERLAMVIEEHEDLAEKAEAELKRVKQELLNYQIELASQMDEKGVTEFKVRRPDGTEFKVSVKDDFRVTMPADRHRAIEWLEANNLGNILKKTVTVSLGRGADPSPLQNALRALGLPFDAKDDVPWNTLTKCMKELLEEGRDFDRSCFNVFEQRVAKVKHSK